MTTKSYQIKFKPSAEKKFFSLPIKIQDKLEKKIDLLSGNPRPQGVKKLVGANSIYRIRSGDYRIIYEIKDKVLLILVLAVGHRKDVYS